MAQKARLCMAVGDISQEHDTLWKCFCWVQAPGFPTHWCCFCCPPIAAPTALPPTHKGPMSLPQAFIYKGASEPWEQWLPTGQKSPEQSKHSQHQTAQVQSADYFRRKFWFPTSPYQAWILERPEYNPKCQQGIGVPSRKQKAPGGNRHSGLSFWLPSPGNCCMAFSPRNEKNPGRLPSPCSCCDSAVSNTLGGWLKMGSAVSIGQFFSQPTGRQLPPKCPGRSQQLYKLKLL